MKVFLLSYVLNCVWNDILDVTHVLNVGHVVLVVHVFHIFHVFHVLNIRSMFPDLGLLRIPQSMQPWQDGTDRSNLSYCLDY